MKKVKNCEVRNCIPTPSGCVDWDGPDIEYLGICTGDPINKLLQEIVDKLKDVAGEDLSAFDIDGLLDICNVKAPQEITLLTILNTIKQNQVCLKDFVNGVSEQLADLLNESKVNVDLGCYQQFDNLQNPLSITRDELDKLVITKLCVHESSIEDLNGKVTNLQEQIDNLDLNQTVEELNFDTCIDTGIKPTSSQVKSVATALCDLRTATGLPAAIQVSLGLVPSDWQTSFSTLTGWNNAPTSMADHFGNALLVINNLVTRVKFMEENCCAVTCDDVKLGFTALMNDTNDGIIIKFTSGAGTSIPSGFTDQGSTGTITDVNGNVESFNIVISNNAEVEIPVSGMDLSGDLKINITAKIGNGSLTCQKCLNKVVKSAICKYCEITASDDVTIMYKICS
jgi:hypothetical protein